MDENLRKRKPPCNSTISGEMGDSLIIIEDIDNEPLEKHQKLSEDTSVETPNPTCDLKTLREDAQIRESTNEVIVIENDEDPPQVSTSSQISDVGMSQQSSGYFSQQSLTTSSVDVAEGDSENQVFEIVEDAEDDKLCASQSAITVEDDDCTDAEVNSSTDIKTQLSSGDNIEIANVSIESSEQLIEQTINDIPEGSTEIPLISDTKTTTNEKNEPVLEVGELNDDIEDSKPTIEINFLDKTTANKYRLKFLNFLKDFPEFVLNIKEELSIRISNDPSLNSKDFILSRTDLSDLEDGSPSKKRKKGQELFVLDTSPTLTTKRLSLTKYEPKFLLQDSSKDGKNEQSNNLRSAPSCFNCNQEHNLRDCPHEKDFRKINAAKQQFRMNNKTMYVRYHVEEDQKYAHLKPGKISSKLKDALGLQSNQLPPYIYKMRVLGYPPGWLEDAKVENSNLSLYDIDGKTLKSTSKPKYGIDSEKIIDYHGFNVPLKKGYKDEHRHYNVPPFLKDFRKEAMIEYFNKQFLREQDDLETCDMDLDADEEQQTAQSEEPSEALQGSKNDDVETTETGPISPSLLDLEKQKENLLAALDDSSMTNNDDSQLQDEASSSNTQDSTVCEPEPITPAKERLNVVKNSSFGTPILKSTSPFQTLPNPDNFSKDVSPVIYFENLPNSTGKYKEMTNVLEKVRTTLKSLQNCK